MRLVRFLAGDRPRLGRVEGYHVVDISGLVPTGDDMRALIEMLATRRREIEGYPGEYHALAEVRLLAPITNPSKFLALGLNYPAHADEGRRAGKTIPDTQVWFNKQVSCINGPYDPIDLPIVSDKLDYEGELGFIIGKRCRHVRAEDALDVIAGYMVMNDVTVRDFQHASPTWTVGKSFDTHGPIGPWITTPDEVGDPQDLYLTLWVNGEVRQATSTSDMIYKIADQIAFLSQAMTLEPGDLIATGTPSGVGIARGIMLKEGDVVRVAVDKLGHIENQVVAESV